MTIHQAFHPPGCGCDSAHARLLSIDAALACISAHATQMQGAEQVPLSLARGRILARPVLSAAMVPPFDNAAMDGFAVQTAALAGPAPGRSGSSRGLRQVWTRMPGFRATQPHAFSPARPFPPVPMRWSCRKR